MSPRNLRLRQLAVLVNGGALILIALFVLSMAQPSTEAARLRNSLLIETGAPANFDWSPQQVPPGYKVETREASPEFARLVRELGVARSGADWERARTIAAHLTRNTKDLGPIQSNLSATLHGIVENGKGYCVDFTTVFMALALAADIPVRQWSFSFDGFGGWGHTFNEIYDSQRGKWVFLDVYNNFFALDRADGMPLSALEFRDSILGRRAEALMVPLGPGRPGFVDPRKARQYYRGGAGEWYLWWGNNVYTYDEHPVLRTLGLASRAAMQFAAIALGIYPTIHVLATKDNSDKVMRMQRLRSELLLLAALWFCLLLALIAQIRSWRWTARSRESLRPDDARPAEPNTLTRPSPK